MVSEDIAKAVLLLADLKEEGYIEFKGGALGLTEKGRLAVKVLEKIAKSRVPPLSRFKGC